MTKANKVHFCCDCAHLYGNAVNTSPFKFKRAWSNIDLAKDHFEGTFQNAFLQTILRRVALLTTIMVL